ncbi:rhodanese-like domain-containing protein [Vibrio mediterranei]|uniref:Sulfurtransferase n=1 Tax=Vibrio mediterranei TaxID=689 RepID=A0ABX5D5Y3_9VIBR|nr:rhodanese-like domain-containing protein [Vibrio mediterranei]PCD85216.1 sulfurtransferase [Vibrio mediterranei]PRQ65052.1 sulfurtransferase [Vibrio mediterranei]
MKKANYNLIDVRSIEEFTRDSIEGSYNVPLQEIHRLANSNLDTSTPVLVYCASGMRASQAEQYLKSFGYAEVVNVGTLQNARNITVTHPEVVK